MRPENFNDFLFNQRERVIQKYCDFCHKLIVAKKFQAIYTNKSGYAGQGITCQKCNVINYLYKVRQGKHWMYSYKTEIRCRVHMLKYSEHLTLKQ